jgi:hypothetical protein
VQVAFLLWDKSLSLIKERKHTDTKRKGRYCAKSQDSQRSWSDPRHHAHGFKWLVPPGIAQLPWAGSLKYVERSLRQSFSVKLISDSPLGNLFSDNTPTPLLLSSWASRISMKTGSLRHRIVGAVKTPLHSTTSGGYIFLTVTICPNPQNVQHKR